jgi:A/G-specific adenine glycosylase
MEKIDFLQLKKWFLKEKRNFPWREDRTDYRVWISEVMLQQTQASRVVAYFERWMQAFPTVSSLARADFAKVIKLWEGLGYYSRVKAIYKAAQYFEQEHGGCLPEREILQTVKGFGPYTVDAISAFARKERVLALDANVCRVLARLFAVSDDVRKLKTKQHLQTLGTPHLPKKDGWVIAEALIELGATVCKPKNPACHACPLQASCTSYAKQMVDRIPYTGKKTEYQKLFREVYVIVYQDEVLLQKQQEGSIMGGLYEFPYSETVPSGCSLEETLQHLLQTFGMDASCIHMLEPVQHSFTRFRVTLYPKVFEVQKKKEVPGYAWHPLDHHEQLTFSSGMKRVLRLYLEELSTCKTL